MVGYVALIEMSLHPKPPISSEGLISSTDHIAVMNGVREVSVDIMAGDKLLGRSYKHEILVTCSAVGPNWIDVQKLVRLHGCARWWLIRKNTNNYHLPFMP
jgi:hypothetical protein